MDERTGFLARLLALYCLVMGGTVLLRPGFFAAGAAGLAADPELLLLAGVLTLFAGLAMVLGHNRWSGGAVTVVVTLVGWLTLAKALLLLLVPGETLGALYGGALGRLWINGAITLALGLWLSCACWRKV
jgi:hypothetical protein